MGENLERTSRQMVAERGGSNLQNRKRVKTYLYDKNREKDKGNGQGGLLFGLEIAITGERWRNWTRQLLKRENSGNGGCERKVKRGGAPCCEIEGKKKKSPGAGSEV